MHSHMVLLSIKRHGANALLLQVQAQGTLSKAIYAKPCTLPHLAEVVPNPAALLYSGNNGCKVVVSQHHLSSLL